MAFLVLGGIGAAIGASVGGTVLGMSAAYFGWTVGSAIGGIIDQRMNTPPATHTEGPRLSSLKVQSSAYGVGIPRCYGQIRVAGNMIWATEIEEVANTVSSGGGGKKKRRKKGGGGGSSATYYTYFGHFAVGLCDTLSTGRAINAVTRIWADGKIIYDHGQYHKCDAIRVYLGTEDQQPDPHIQAHQGVANTPAFRGCAYIVFQRLALADFGNRIPNITVEIQELPPEERTTVGHIVEREAILSGYEMDDLEIGDLYNYDITGMLVQQPMPARNVIEQLQMFKPFDLVESNGKLRCTLRHDEPDIEIPEEHLGAALNEKDPGPVFTLTHVGDWDCPREVTIGYIDQNADYEQGAQMARRIDVDSVATVKADLAIAMSGRMARAIAEQRLWTTWTERDTVAITLPFEYVQLDPGDVIKLRNMRIRITELRIAPSLINVTGIPMSAETYAGEFVVDPPPQKPVYERPVDSLAIIRDLTPLTDEDTDFGVYAMVAAKGEPWDGADIWSSFKQDKDYSYFWPAGQRVVYGKLTHNLYPTQTLYFDYKSEIKLQLEYGELAECEEEDLLDWANVLIIGDEIIQFQEAEHNGTSWTLRKLLRGRKGSEHAMVPHMAGALVVLLSWDTVYRVPLDQIELGVTRYYKAVTAGLTNLDGAEVSDERLDGNSVLPFFPVHIAGSRVDDYQGGPGSWKIDWVRRARVRSEWTNNIDVPLDEPTMAFDLEITDAYGTVVRTVEGVTATTWTYSAADQIADLGHLAAGFAVNIYQISSKIGRGRPGTAWIGEE